MEVDWIRIVLLLLASVAFIGLVLAGCQWIQTGRLCDNIHKRKAKPRQYLLDRISAIGTDAND